MVQHGCEEQSRLGESTRTGRFPIPPAPPCLQIGDWIDLDCTPRDADGRVTRTSSPTSSRSRSARLSNRRGALAWGHAGCRPMRRAEQLRAWFMRSSGKRRQPRRRFRRGRRGRLSLVSGRPGLLHRWSLAPTSSSITFYYFASSAESVGDLGRKPSREARGWRRSGKWWRLRDPNTNLPPPVCAERGAEPRLARRFSPFKWLRKK